MRVGRSETDGPRGRRPRWWIFAAALVLVLLLCLAFWDYFSSEESSRSDGTATEHPVIEEGVACSSCKELGHDLKHEVPYDDPDCLLCHDLGSWRNIRYAHDDSDFDDGTHAIVGCGFCHTKPVPTPSADCLACHETNHVVAKPCVNCHTPWTWRILEPLPAGHPATGGGHTGLICYECHVGVTAFSAPKQCVACHGIRHGGLTACRACHDPLLGWNSVPSFRHSDYYKLSGRHAKLACTKCHPGYRFVGTPTTCVSCHGAKHGGITACATCHTTAAFVPSTFRHYRVWRLTGAHARIACTKCHPRSKYATAIGSASSCSSCHGARHGGLTACTRCHTTSTFVPSTFVHSRVWALTGKHALVPCASCHPKSLYAQTVGSPSACTNCHGVAHGNQTACAKCHTTAGFSPALPKAHPVFPVLSGDHAVLACTLCHPALNFAVAPKPCSDCHTAPHVEPTDCLRCHRPSVWSELHFAHSDIAYHTSIPYESACPWCHTTGNYGTYDCTGCHAPF